MSNRHVPFCDQYRSELRIGRGRVRTSRALAALSKIASHSNPLVRPLHRERPFYLERAMFPVIETVADVLPHIQGNIGFFLTRFDDYDVIDYGFVGDDTFRSPMALECRGLKFDKDGRLIARPFHKFFNLGERQRPEDIDWTVPHVVLSKLDGSMVHPCVVRGELVFMTRMGVTAQSSAALKHADEDIRSLSKWAVEAGITALFEFTSPENRVVIAYDQPSLTLLAARDNRTGRYSTHQELQSLADQFDVPLIPSLQMTTPTRDFVTIARSEEGIEGYVIAMTVIDSNSRPHSMLYGTRRCLVLLMKKISLHGWRKVLWTMWFRSLQPTLPKS
ncbi:hypothetical protein CK219_13535 [Mesorhizobium sp. WSM4313]|nr:hypothetical protein CK219_13535 [Mesorhizobium sp. WSM4313]